MPDSQTKTAIITGASRGLGAALAFAFAKQGFDLCLIARSADELQQLQQQISSTYSVTVSLYPYDLSNLMGITALVERIHSDHPSIDLLINNAGFGHYKPMNEHSPSEIINMVNVNLTAPMLLTREVVTIMSKQNKGHVINIGSDLAQKPLANMTPYVATKHGLQGFSDSLLREVKGQGIKVTIINTGVIATYFHNDQPSDHAPDTSLDPKQVADLIVQVYQTPSLQVVDQITLHPINQEF